MSGPFSSVLQEIRLVRPDGAAEAVQREHDRQTDGDFRGLGGDEEEGEHLPGVAGASGHRAGHRGDVDAVVGDEREVRRVEHQLDAHELHEHVAPDDEADAADDEDEGAQRAVLFDRHQAPPLLSAPSPRWISWLKTPELLSATTTTGASWILRSPIESVW